MKNWGYWDYDDDNTLRPRHEIQARRKQGRIRYALCGLAVGAFAIAMIRPLCAWMVWAGNLLEGWF